MATANKKGDVYIINKFKVRNQPFRCIMIYQDVDSGFCFIKPLLYKIPLEIVTELFKIFTSYGPPTVVDVNSCSQDMVNSISNYMELLCPLFNVQFKKASLEKNNIALAVISRLHKWLEITNKQQWEIGCCIVQRQINTEVDSDNNTTPHERFFKNLGTICNNVDYSVNIPEDPKLHEQSFVDNIVKMENVPNQSKNTQNTDKVNYINNNAPVNIKNEVLESDDINELSKNLSNYVIIYDGGVAFPNFNDNGIPVKQEIADD